MALLTSQNKLYTPLGLEVSGDWPFLASTASYALLSHPYSPKPHTGPEFQEMMSYDDDDDDFVHEEKFPPLP